MDGNAVLKENNVATTPARWRRYAKVTLANVSVRRASSPRDFEIVSNLRSQGFGRLIADATPRNWVDASDYESGTYSLLAFTEIGEAIATLRVQDGRESILELATRVQLESILLPEHYPLAQFARLSVCKHPEAYEGMFALFKAAWRWCLENDLQSIVIASPPWARPIYDFMCFDDLGQNGRFAHELVGGAEHVSMRLDVPGAEKIWRTHKLPICTAFFDVIHPQICANDPIAA